MIRILHVLGTLERGGTEMMLMNLYDKIDRTQIQFDFIVHGEKKGSLEENILKFGGKIYRFPRYNIKNHFYYKNYWKNFLKNHTEYKILHGHLRGSAFVYLKIAKKNGLKTIMHSHSTSSRGKNIEKIIKNFLIYPLRKWVDYPFACSLEAGKWLFGKNILGNPNFKIIKNSIDSKKYIFNKDTRKEIRNKLNIKNEIVIGHIGSFTYPKNHNFILDIFYEFQKKNPNSMLLLLGDGELREKIQSKILKLKIEKKVIMTGIVSDTYNYLQAMDLFLFPSFFEGLPVSIVEAQASGLRCLLSSVITKEIDLHCELIEFENLNTDITTWVEKLEVMKEYYRKDTKDSLFKAGYDINESSQILSDIYNNIF